MTITHSGHKKPFSISGRAATCVLFNGPADFNALVDKEFEYWGKVIKAGNIKAGEQ